MFQLPHLERNKIDFFSGMEILIFSDKANAFKFTHAQIDIIVIH